jgi:hypothetical protein
VAQLQLIWDDVAELVRNNPLAAEQLKNIALQRQISELERRLAEAAVGKLDGAGDGDAIALAGSEVSP